MSPRSPPWTSPRQGHHSPIHPSLWLTQEMTSPLLAFGHSKRKLRGPGSLGHASLFLLEGTFPHYFPPPDARCNFINTGDHQCLSIFSSLRVSYFFSGLLSLKQIPPFNDSTVALTFCDIRMNGGLIFPLPPLRSSAFRPPILFESLTSLTPPF